jgi:hypothetical protein
VVVVMVFGKLDGLDGWEFVRENDGDRSYKIRGRHLSVYNTTWRLDSESLGDGSAILI